MRKLKFTEVMLVSKILKDINVKYYVEYLLSNKIEKLLKKTDVSLEDKQRIIAVDVIAFIAQNMADAEDNVYRLFSSYTGDKLEIVKDYDFDKVLELFGEIVKNGLPKVLGDMIDFGDVKKKLSSLAMEASVQN